MPMPTPSNMEKRDKDGKNHFMNRCMGSEMMQKEFPKNDQRIAVCMSAYKRAKEKKKSKGSVEEPNWDDIETQDYLMLP